EAEWDAVLDTNLKSQFACIHFALPLMRRTGWGRIINVGSNVGLFGLSSFSAYGAAKGGALGLTFSMAVELRGSGITVNCLLPSSETIRLERSRAERMARTGFVEVPSARRTPEAIAPVVAYLASDAAAGISGQVVYSAAGVITLYSWPPTS